MPTEYGFETVGEEKKRFEHERQARKVELVQAIHDAVPNFDDIDSKVQAILLDYARSREDTSVTTSFEFGRGPSEVDKGSGRYRWKLIGTWYLDGRKYDESVSIGKDTDFLPSRQFVLRILREDWAGQSEAVARALHAETGLPVEITYVEECHHGLRWIINTIVAARSG